MNTWHKNISNPVDTPWLDWIENGIKIYEGRLNKGDWSNMKIGDVIVFSSNDQNIEKTIAVEIVNIKKYDTFGDAFRKHGCQLVPISDISSFAVDKLYSQYFSDEDVKRYGVLVFKIHVIDE